MTPLRRRMIEDFTLQGYAARTIQAYVGAVAQLAAHFARSPALLSEDEVRRYLVPLATEKKVARGTHTIALCGIKFFYQRTLGREWNVFEVARPRKVKKLPVVLSRDEVWKVLACVRLPVYRVCLITIYSCGLRLMEGAHLRVEHVDGGRTRTRAGSSRPLTTGPVPPAPMEASPPSRATACSRGSGARSSRAASRGAPTSTHRVAFANRRILALDDDSVSFSWKDYAHGHRTRVLTLDLVEFARRFLLHVLPPRFVRIRHYGFLANRRRAQRLATIRSLLDRDNLVASAVSEAPAPSAANGDSDLLEDPSSRRCPVCKRGTLRCVAILMPAGPLSRPLALFDSS